MDNNQVSRRDFLLLIACSRQPCSFALSISKRTPLLIELVRVFRGYQSVSRYADHNWAARSMIDTALS